MAVVRSYWFSIYTVLLKNHPKPPGNHVIAIVIFFKTFTIAVGYKIKVAMPNPKVVFREIWKAVLNEPAKMKLGGGGECL